MLGASSQVGVRPARQGDGEALSVVFSASWQNAYQGIIPDPHLEFMISRRPGKWWTHAIASRNDILVVEVKDEIAGYANYGATRSDSPQQGEIYELYLSPVYQGIGLGELLFEACRNKLDQKKYNGLLVWVLAENTAAIDFYWRRGGRPVAEGTHVIGEVKLPKVALAWN